MPVVTATCPRRLNHPVTQDANGAERGGESIAAQKYGPPLVGCALQTSEDNLSTSAVDYSTNVAYSPAIESPTIIVKNAESLFSLTGITLAKLRTHKRLANSKPLLQGLQSSVLVR